MARRYHYKPKACDICGEMYVPRSSQQLYCDPCRRRKHIEATHAWHASEHGREMTRRYKIAKRGEEHQLVEVEVKGIVYLRPMVPCPDCGKMFLRSSNGMKRCEACARLKHRERGREDAIRKAMEVYPQRKAALEAQIVQAEADLAAGLISRRRLVSLRNSLGRLVESHMRHIGDEEGLARIKAERDARKAEQEARAKERAIIVAGNAMLRKAEAEARAAEKARKAAEREAKKKARAVALDAKREARRQKAKALLEARMQKAERKAAEREACRAEREAARAAERSAKRLAQDAARAKREEARRKLAEAISAEKKAMASMPPCEPRPIYGRKRLACDPKELRTVETTLEMRYCARLHMSSSNLPCGKDQVLCGGCEYNVKPMLRRVERARPWGWEG